jgi:hypothetical protein
MDVLHKDLRVADEEDVWSLEPQIVLRFNNSGFGREFKHLGHFAHPHTTPSFRVSKWAWGVRKGVDPSSQAACPGRLLIRSRHSAIPGHGWKARHFAWAFQVPGVEWGLVFFLDLFFEIAKAFLDIAGAQRNLRAHQSSQA